MFSDDFNGGFNDEKNSGIEIIHHGVRTIQGGGNTLYLIFGSALKNLVK